MMKDKLHKLIDAIFDDDPEEVKSEHRSQKPIRAFWRKPICKNNPLEPPKAQRPILGQRITPSWIEELEVNEIFVFGSNTRGIHDGGASFTAVQCFGAIVGQAEGPQGQSYAIPTDGASLSDIQTSVKSFIIYAKAHQHLTFLVTEIRCGTAGYHPMDIGPLFKDAVSVPNYEIERITGYKFHDANSLERRQAMFEPLLIYRVHLEEIHHAYDGFYETSRGFLYGCNHSRKINQEIMQLVKEKVDRVIFLLLGDKYDKTLTI